MDLGHEGGWHGEHEALHQHAWAWALTQAQYPYHGQTQGTHLHHKLGSGAPIQTLTQCHHGQTQNSSPSQTWAWCPNSSPNPFPLWATPRHPFPSQPTSSPVHHFRTELPISSLTRSEVAVEWKGSRGTRCR